MSNTNTEQTGVVKTQSSITKQFFTQDNVRSRFDELLGRKSAGFISSVLQCINSNKSLVNADTNTIFQAAMMAATLDLPINNNLGFAWIVPYNESSQIEGRWVKKCVAQFQIGWKGFVQLAQRTAQYKRINATEVFQNQFKSYNTLTEELIADFQIEGEGDVIGYAAHFKLVNGFEKTVYWSRKKVDDHAKKYSKAYAGDGKTPWKDPDQFHEMAKKTVLKLALSKWGILSIEMQMAMAADQGIIKDAETQDIDYVDNSNDSFSQDPAEDIAAKKAGMKDKKTKSVNPVNAMP